MIRAVIDVNVIISSVLLLRGVPYQIVEAWRRGLFISVTSEGIITTVRTRLRDSEMIRPYSVSSEDIHAVVRLLTSRSYIVPVPLSRIVPVTGDPEDDYVLATALVSNADFLVTGDRRLQSLGAYGDVAIVRPRAFLDMVTAQQSE